MIIDERIVIPDTNVVSEGSRREPSAAVRAWLDEQRPEDLYLAVPVLAEVRLGLHLMPNGRRKDAVTISVRSILVNWFSDRVLAFDGAAAEFYARIMAQARSSGRPIGIMDCQIAAIAAARNATVATRDTAPFAAAGVPTINPWQA